MRFATAFILPALFVLLAACAGAPIVSRNQASPPPDSDEIRDLIVGRATPVVVTTSPFAALPPARLAQQVAAAMPRFYNARYWPAPSPYVAADYLLVWQFAGAQRNGASNISASLALLTPGAPPISEVQGHVEGVAGPDDPAFRHFIQQMTLGALWPDREFGGSGGGGLQLFLFP